MATQQEIADHLGLSWRQVAAQANRTEREVALMDGRLLDATRVEQVWYAMVANFRQRMLALPAHAAHLVAHQDPDVAHDVLERAIHEALRELADYDVAQYAPAIEAKATRGNGIAATQRKDVSGSRD